MFITVFGATGQVGKRIVNMALAKQHTVLAFSRDITNLIDADIANDKFIATKGYVFDKDDVFNAVKNADVILSALGGSFDGTDKTRSLGVKNIVEQMQAASKMRILIVSGMGVLKDDEYGYIINRPGYPEQYKPVGEEHLKAYLHLKDSGLDWTCVCCPDIVNADANGNYVTREDYPPENGTGKINAGNIADFILNEMNEDRFLQHRVGISNL